VIVLDGDYAEVADGLMASFTSDGVQLDGQIVTATKAGVAVMVPPQLKAPADAVVTLLGAADEPQLTISVSQLPLSVRKVLYNQTQSGTLCDIALAKYLGEYQASRTLSRGGEEYASGLVDADLTLAELLVGMSLWYGMQKIDASVGESLALLVTRLSFDDELCKLVGHTLSMIDLINGYESLEEATEASTPTGAGSDPLVFLHGLQGSETMADLLYSPPSPPPSPPTSPPPPPRLPGAYKIDVHGDEAAITFETGTQTCRLQFHDEGHLASTCSVVMMYPWPLFTDDEISDLPKTTPRVTVRPSEGAIVFENGRSHECRLWLNEDGHLATGCTMDQGARPSHWGGGGPAIDPQAGVTAKRILLHTNRDGAARIEFSNGRGARCILQFTNERLLEASCPWLGATSS